jgi:hypothetical protein
VETSTQKTATDELLDSYLAWRGASTGVQAAYDRWEGSLRSERDVAFGGYLAALQLEHHAARVYQRRLEHVRALS